VTLQQYTGLNSRLVIFLYLFNSHLPTYFQNPIWSGTTRLIFFNKGTFQIAFLISPISFSQEKYYWRRYIYLWIYYALFEELKACDATRTRDVYSMCLKLIPHKKFTFAKVWLMFAKFEIRQKNLQAARRILVNPTKFHPNSKK